MEMNRIESPRGRHPTMPSASTRAWFLERVQSEQSRLRASIRALGVRAEAVDDLAQEALVIALERIDEFDREGEGEGGGDFGAWVRRIARHLVANERRKEARRGRILSEHVSDLLLDPADDSASPAEGQEREEELAALRECLDGLPNSSRDLLRRRYFEGLSPGAIGSHTGRPSNQVRQALLRLRRALLGCIERRLGDGWV
jgi:RNA polymerase sigma-70 factor